MDLLKDYVEARRLLDKLRRVAEDAATPDGCGCKECRAELTETLNEAADFVHVAEQDRCGAEYVLTNSPEDHQTLSCVRRYHDDPWHTAGGPAGCWKAEVE